MTPAFLLTLGTALAVDASPEARQRAAQVRASMLTHDWTWLEDHPDLDAILDGLRRWTLQSPSFSCLTNRLNSLAEAVAFDSFFYMHSSLPNALYLWIYPAMSPVQVHHPDYPPRVRAWGSPPENLGTSNLGEVFWRQVHRALFPKPSEDSSFSQGLNLWSWDQTTREILLEWVDKPTGPRFVAATIPDLWL
jgi:hypothetical protein